MLTMEQMCTCNVPKRIITQTSLKLTFCFLSFFTVFQIFVLLYRFRSLLLLESGLFPDAADSCSQQQKAEGQKHNLNE